MLCGFLFLTLACGAGKNKKDNEQITTVGGKDCSRRKNLVAEIKKHDMCESGQNSHHGKSQKSVYTRKFQQCWTEHGKLSCGFIW